MKIVMILLALVCGAFAQQDSIKVEPIKELTLPVATKMFIELETRQRQGAGTQRPQIFSEVNREIIEEHLNNPQVSGSIVAQTGSFNGNGRRR